MTTPGPGTPSHAVTHLAELFPSLDRDLIAVRMLQCHQPPRVQVPRGLRALQAGGRLAELLQGGAQRPDCWMCGLRGAAGRGDGK